MKTLLIASLTAVFAALASCSNAPQHEKPIRPVSENSDIAHGHSAPQGSGFGGVDAFSR